MPRTDSPAFHGPHRALLEALTLARAAQHTQQVRTQRWLVALGVVSVALWPVTGFQVAMLTFVVGCVAMLSVAAHGRGPVRQSPAARHADAVAGEVERRVFAAVAQDVAPALHIRQSSPLGILTVASARLLCRSPDFLHVSRCVTGLHAGAVPFCVSHIEAGRAIQTRRLQPRHEYVREIYARGLLSVMDVPRTEGWVAVTTRHGNEVDLFLTPTDADVVLHGSLEFDEQFAARASSVEAARAALTDDVVTRLLTLRRRWPGVTFGVSVHDGTMTCIVPQAINPLALGNNPARWEAELDRSTLALQQVQTLLDVMHGTDSDAATRAA